MGKYQHEAQELLKAIGGKENVTEVTREFDSLNDTKVL
jgi:phosphotransferase system IIB component